MVDQIEGNEVLLANVSAETEAENETTATASATGTNLLTNGSFENPVLPEEGFGGFETVEGWNAITDGQIEIWRNRLGIEATDGVNFLELDYVDGQDGFSQSVDTVAGQDYTLTFDTRLSEAQDVASQGIEVVWNGEVIATVYPGSTEWEEMSFTVTGTGGSDTLTIREPGDGTQNDGLGALLDNFALVAEGGPVINYINGTLENDLIAGTEGADRIRALTGDDTVEARGGDDIVFGEDGNDRLFGESGDDQLVGGTGFDELRGGAGDDQMWGEDGRDFLDGGIDNDILVGGAGDDILVGGVGDGYDQLWGEDGNDALHGGMGGDRLDGGQGQDSFLYDSAEEMIGDIIQDFSTEDVILFSPGVGTGLGVSSYIGTEAFSGVANQIRSEIVGNNTRLEVDVDGDGVADGSLLAVNYTAGFVAEETNSGFRLVAPPAFNEILGTSEDEILIGTDSNDRIQGLAGDDVLFGFGGNDLLIGGLGDDGLVAGSGANTLLGGGGNDLLSSGTGNDVLDGGDGIDYVQYQDLTGYDVTVDLETGEAFGINAAGDTFIDQVLNIETVVTGAGDDTILGDENANLVLANDGDDILSGGDGNDRLEGRNGNDEVYGDGGNDSLSGGAGEDIVFGNQGNDSLYGGAGADQLTGGEDTDIFLYSDRLTEMFGDEILDFTSGEAIAFRYGIEEVQPTFIGSDAFGGNAGEIRNEIVGTDTIFQIDLDGDGLSDGSMIVRNYSEDFVLQSVSGGFQLVGRSTINEIIGTNEGETLTGTDGDDRILGLAGSDRIIGSLGNDEIEGGADFDRLDYSSLSEFSLDIDLSAGRVTGEDVNGNSFTDQLEGIEWISGSDLNDTIRGDEGNNHLHGNGGDDVIFGGAGFDTLSGGAGSDMLIGGEGSDTLRSGQGNDFLDGGEGMDVAAYEQTIGFAYDVNLLTGVVTGNDGNGNTFTDQLVNIEYVVTSTGNDVVVGDDGSNFLITNAGDDVIDGRGGDDTISGGAGSDRMTGGEGSDQFTILNPEYAFGDVITDFSRGDGLQIFNRFDDEDAVASYIGSDAFSGVVGQIRSERVGIDTVLEMDIDGDGVSDGSMTLENFSGTLDSALLGDRIFISVGSEPPTPGTNLLTNGSFENPILPEEGFGGFETVEGWNAITDGQIEIWRNRLGIEATDGVNFLELDYVDGQDGFSQSVDTAAGQDYTLTFDTRLSEAQDIASQGIEVVWNGEVIATVYPGSTEWEEMSFTVTGTGGSDTLTIREPGDGTQNDGLGALLDNFALVADGAEGTETAMAGTVKLTLDLAESSDIIDGGETSSDFVSTVFEASASLAMGQGSGSNPLEAAYLAHHVQSVADALLDNAPVMLVLQDYDADMGLFSVEDSLIDASWDIA